MLTDPNQVPEDRVTDERLRDILAFQFSRDEYGREFRALAREVEVSRAFWARVANPDPELIEAMAREQSDDWDALNPGNRQVALEFAHLDLLCIAAARLALSIRARQKAVSEAQS